MQCDICQGEVSDDEVIELQGQRVCASCKPGVMQRLQEGLESLLPEPERARVLRVVRLQRQMVACIACACTAFVVLGVVASQNHGESSSMTQAMVTFVTFWILRVGLVIWECRCIYRLGEAVPKSDYRIWTGLAMAGLVLVPLDIVSMLYINSGASGYLRKQGVRVGLFGVRARDLPA